MSGWAAATLLNNDEQLCSYAYDRIAGSRVDAVNSFRQLPLYARFFRGDPEDLTDAAYHNLRRDWYGRFSNASLPDFCDQHDWPAPKLPPKEVLLSAKRPPTP